MIKNNLKIAALCALAASLLGCGSQNGATATTAELNEYNKKANIDPAKVNQFLSELEATPQAQRRDFVNQHPDEMRSLSDSRDPAIQSRFHKIIGGSPL